MQQPRERRHTGQPAKKRSSDEQSRNHHTASATRQQMPEQTTQTQDDISVYEIAAAASAALWEREAQQNGKLQNFCADRVCNGVTAGGNVIV